MSLPLSVQQNVGIALAKFRMPSNEICRAIVQMDSSRLDLDKLLSLRALAPSSDDLSVLKEYDGDVDKLGKVEKFFLHINEIPRYIPRLDCFIFMRKFQLLVSEMYQQYDVMNRALDQIENSLSFRSILEIVLALGNYLNGSTPRGGFYGFKLEGLLKLSAVKSVDNKLNLMHFLVKQCRAADEKMLGVREELSMAEEASRISLETCKADITSLRSNLRTVQEAIEAQRLDTEPDETDRLVEVLTPFQLEAGAEIARLEDEFRSISQRFYKTVVKFGGEKDQHTFTGFFSLIKDFIQGFSKAHRDIEKRRVMKDKLERKRVRNILTFDVFCVDNVQVSACVVITVSFFLFVYLLSDCRREGEEGPTGEEERHFGRRDAHRRRVLRAEGQEGGRDHRLAQGRVAHGPEGGSEEQQAAHRSSAEEEGGRGRGVQCGRRRCAGGHDAEAGGGGQTQQQQQQQGRRGRRRRRRGGGGATAGSRCLRLWLYSSQH
jgi:hypothetical protein